VYQRILHELAQNLSKRGGIEIRAIFIEGSLAAAEKGAFLSGYQALKWH
jgi:hypothetical protein